MKVNDIAPGVNPPDDFNAIIEIPLDGTPVKYEVDKDTGAILVNRLLATSMRYPCNYGFVPNTLAEDGDPLDVMVLIRVPLLPGSVIRCRPIGFLEMSDEAGRDVKIAALPVEQVSPLHEDITSVDDLARFSRRQIRHFFTHYKDLEYGKWVEVLGWHGPDAAREEILKSIEAFKNNG
ncbi:inorganic diphosphatase [Wenzhouxiangella sp. AB-CW3]|uniref:inorganic diphosphatase n=1 Tax=Wenzhouxiangella sp. AB-CW3 TaxID=2771012 RepID=UPI00168C02EC|nr:inorganic diphosphatase [Wenzhouxiangella sp. AB-CW3]QOC23128.1 inorganic diphosphatase [Wenzhouxiangella sp. AB-CW3]